MEVLALSTDSIYAHKVFTEVSPSGRKVNFPLLSDRSGHVPWIYGALDPEQGLARRVTILIDPEGRIALYLVYPLEVGRSTDELLRLIRAVQFNRETGLGVPANWQPGEPGLRRDIERAGEI